MSTTTLPSESEIGLIHPFAVSPDSMATVKKESWNEIVNELNQLRALQDDWDGQGADAPTAANLDIALAWIERMRCWPSALPPTKVVPGVTGEVYLVWQHASLYLEAEIDGDREVEWLLSETEKPARQWKTDLDGTWMVGVVH